MPIRRYPRASGKTRSRAQELRSQSTKPEIILWSILRRKQIDGVKFRRQHPFDPYIVDFYCPSAKLVIEIDGMTHMGRHAEDEQRANFLASLGLRVMRFTNDQVLQDPWAVAESIWRVVEQAVK